MEGAFITMCKNITKVVILLLAVLMIVSTPAFAMDMRASSRIISSSARVRSGDDSNLWVYFSITASSTMDNIGASKIVIQRYSDSHWVPECVLTSEDFPEIQASDVSRHSTSISYKPMYSGYKYRAVVSVYASDSSGISSTSVTSRHIMM